MLSIVIVDDEEFVTTSLRKFITEYQPDYQVRGTFTSAAEALSFLRETPVDVIITDICMPQMDGLEMIQEIRNLLPEVEIIVISGYSEFAYAQKACAFHVRNYLLKPIDRQELSNNLEAIAARLQYVPSRPTDPDEDVHNFFMDLLSRVITDKRELHKRFSRLSIAADSRDYKGCLLSVTLEQDAQRFRKQSIETLPTAMLNKLRLSLPEYKVYYLFRHQLCFYYVLLSARDVPTFSPETLARSLCQGRLRCTVRVSTTFHSLDALLSGHELPISAPDAEQADDLVIQHAMDFIRTHYADNLSREDVANVVYLDSAYFSRLFKQKTGMSFINFLTSVRMEKAKELLSTQMSINDIATAVGYLHRNRFITNFRECTGYTPSEYRKKIIMGGNADEP